MEVERDFEKKEKERRSARDEKQSELTQALLPSKTVIHTHSAHQGRESLGLCLMISSSPTKRRILSSGLVIGTDPELLVSLCSPFDDLSLVLPPSLPFLPFLA